MEHEDQDSQPERAQDIGAEFLPIELRAFRSLDRIATSLERIAEALEHIDRTGIRTWDANQI